ncbi:MAG: (Fe-S)-binding protein [Actinomycetota bacterium]|nr:(Fe-S)-binding protein [Actinomycetota bacterium]
MFSAYAHVPGYLLVFPLIVACIAYFGLATARHLRILALARPSQPYGNVPGRIGSLVRYALGQAKMFKELRAGLMHAAIFWGFVLLTIGTADILTGGLISAVVSWPLNGALWAAIAFMQNVVAVVVLIAIAYAFWRRLVTRPSRLTFTRGALIILGLIGGVVAAEVLSTAFEAAKFGDRPGALITDAMAIPIRTLSAATISVGFAVLWWTHIVLVAAFICYLPGSKHLHIVTSFFNIYLGKAAPRGELPAMDLEREDETFGVRTITDFGWKDLLDGFTCTECGRCTAACPANLTGKVLNPKEMIMGIRHMAVDGEQGVSLVPFGGAGWSLPGADGSRSAIALGRRVVDEAIPYTAVWDCVTCGACVDACPVLIEHVDKIVGLRRNLVLEDARFPTELGTMFRNLEKAGNPWGQPASARMDWTRGLPFEVPTVAELARAGRLQTVEVLYWVGCAAAFEERAMNVARAVATCLAAAGVRFAVLGPEESCTGDPARRSGNEYVYQLLATSNIETLSRYGMEQRTIITACPHCMNAIGVEYGQLGGRFRVVHHSVYLRQLLADGRLPVASGGTVESVTLHDSCYLARYNDIVAEPREIIRTLPMLELREMERRERSTFCCGAGGGRMWMEESRGTKINVERARQVMSTAAKTVVTECPFCMTMLRDGLAAVAGPADVETADLAEIVAARLAPIDRTGLTAAAPAEQVS